MIVVDVRIDLAGALGELAGPLTDRPMMAALGALQAARIKDRTVARGQGLDGRPLKPYSTTPLYVSPRSGAGLRLRPKGGRPTKVGRRRGVSRFYAGGYAQYKRESTRRSGGSLVDYVASGRTMASLRMLSAGRDRAVVGFSGGEARRIAAGLQARDPFFGVGAGDEEALTEEAAAQVERIIEGRRRAGRRA